MPEKKKLSLYEKSLALKYEANEAKKMPFMKKAAAIESVVDDAIELICEIAFKLEQVK